MRTSYDVGEFIRCVALEPVTPARLVSLNGLLYLRSATGTQPVNAADQLPTWLSDKEYLEALKLLKDARAKGLIQSSTRKE